ncbi:MAG: hypothetical protein NXI14_05930 [bacterium]|nr:hypothetical protein [bacterium]
MADRLTLRQAESTIQQILADRLKRYGFSRPDLLEFERAIGGICTQYVRVSVRRVSSSVFFGCHLVIEPEEVKRAFARLDRLPDLNCALFCPIQRFCGDDRPSEWSADSPATVCDAAADLVDEIEKSGLRLFSDFEDTDRIIAELESEIDSRVLLTDSLSGVAMLAVLYLAQGRREAAERAFDEEIASGRHEGPRRRPRIESVRRQLLGESSGPRES